MKNTGLVSVSFRGLTPEQIFGMTKEASLNCIEWGADIHCKPGDSSASDNINGLARKYGVKTCSYGSYYRAGTKGEGNADFSDILGTAKNIGAAVIRVWAFNKGRSDTTQEEYGEAVSDLKNICEAAGKEGVKIALECHNNTLTDDYRSSIELLSDVGSDNLYMYWQPNQFRTLEYNLESAKALGGYVTNVHVFNWLGNEKYPLSEAVDTWKRYVEILEKSGTGHNYLLEFMPHGDPSELPQEARALREILR